MIELFASSAPLFIGTVFVLSLLIGSFLNVVIHRLPIMLDREWKAQAAEIVKSMSGASPPATLSPLAPASSRYNLIVPRSACPHCGVLIGALHNIPVLSYLALKGRCGSCSAPISVRYPVVARNLTAYR